MKNWRIIFLLIIVVVFVWFIKFYLGFPNTDVGVIGIILSISSILFGLLTGFFISELWSRYTEIRSLQGDRSAAGMSMIKHAEYFFKNKKFKKEFGVKVEKSAVADEIINWDEGHLEEPYYRNIEDSFSSLKINGTKEGQYFQALMNDLREYYRTTTRMNILYKERLFFSEWLILIVLSIVIIVSVLFLDQSHLLYRMIILVFPAVIVLALSIIYDLDKMTWGRELITMEPTQIILDAIGVKRFYLKRDLKFVSKRIKDKGYRTEDDLKGELKKVHQNILKERELSK